MRHANLRALPSGGMTGSVMLSAVETSHWVSTLIGGILRFALNDTREKSFAYNRRGLTVVILRFALNDSNVFAFVLGDSSLRSE